MTLEEAGEILLRNEPWEACLCVTRYRVGCMICENSGAVLKAEYREACEVIGQEPPPTWRMTTPRQGFVAYFGPPHFVGKFPSQASLANDGPNQTCPKATTRSLSTQTRY